MAAVVERERELRTKIAWGKRLSFGRPFRTDIGSDRRPAGPDFERDSCGTAQATDSHQQECGRTVFRATRHDLQKKRVCGPRNSSAETWRGCRPECGWNFAR